MSNQLGLEVKKLHDEIGRLRYALQKELEITRDLRNHADKTKIKIEELALSNSLWQEKVLEQIALEEWLDKNHADTLTTFKVLQRMGETK